MNEDVNGQARPVAGVVAATVAVAAWGITSVIPPLVDGMGGIAISFHRLWVFAVATTIVFSATGGRLTWGLLRRSAAGGVAFGLDVALFFSALKLTTVANATVLGALQPALVLVLVGPLFGERIRLRTVALTAVAVAGTVAVVLGSTGAPTWSLYGDLLAVGALFSFTWYFVASKRARRALSSLEYLTGFTIVAAVVVAPLALVSGQPLVVGDGRDWALIGLLALVSGGVGHVLVNWAHAHVDLWVVSLLTLAIPVFATGAAVVVLDEPVTAVQLGGMAVVIVALAAVVRPSRSAPLAAPAAEAAAEVP